MMATYDVCLPNMPAKVQAATHPAVVGREEIGAGWYRLTLRDDADVEAFLYFLVRKLGVQNISPYSGAPPHAPLDGDEPGDVNPADYVDL